MARYCRNLATCVVISLPLAGILMGFASEGLVISNFERLVMWLACWIIAAVALAGMVKAWKAAYENSQFLRSAMSLLDRNWVVIFMFGGGILIAIDFLKEDTHIGYLGAMLWLIVVINIIWKVICMTFEKIMFFFKPKRMAAFAYPKPQLRASTGPVCPMCNAPFGKSCIDGRGQPRARHNARQ